MLMMPELNSRRSGGQGTEALCEPCRSLHGAVQQLPEHVWLERAQHLPAWHPLLQAASARACLDQQAKVQEDVRQHNITEQDLGDYMYAGVRTLHLCVRAVQSLKAPGQQLAVCVGGPRLQRCGPCLFPCPGRQGDRRAPPRC